MQIAPGAKRQICAFLFSRITPAITACDECKKQVILVGTQWELLEQRNNTVCSTSRIRRLE